MKKLNLIFIFIFLLIFQISAYAQKTDFFSFFGIDSKAEEIYELRTEISKTFLNPDETFTTIIFNVPIHQIDLNQQWADIYLPDDLLTIEEQAVYLMKMVNNSLTTWISADGFSIGRSMDMGTQFYTLDRAYLRWDTSPIPDNATLHSTNINFSGGTSQVFPIKYYITRMDKDPGPTRPTDQTKIESIFNDCFTGSYTNNNPIQHPNNFRDTSSNQTGFLADLRSHLDSNWMAVGMMNYREDSTKFKFTGPDISALVVNYPPLPTMQLSVTPATNNLNTGNPTDGYFTATNVNANGMINYTVTENSSWLSLERDSGNTTTTPGIHFFATANTGSDYRVDTIIVTALNSNVTNPIRKVLVRQPPQSTPTLHVNTTSVGAASNGDKDTIYVTNSTSSTSINYSVSNGANWVTISPSNGSTSSSFVINTKANFTDVSRSARIYVISDPVVNGSPKAIDIYQGRASTLTLPDEEIPGQQTYFASNWIIANSFYVGHGGNIQSLTLGAGTKITLKPGFTAKSDAGTFRAYIHNFPEEQDYIAGETGEQGHNKNALSMKGDGKDGETDNIVEEIPDEYDLFQNYPNPFNPTTNIKFALPERSYVHLAVYNIVGQKVAELTNNELEAGYHTIQFNGSMLSSGLYFYRITTNKFSKTYKMLLVK